MTPSVLIGLSFGLTFGVPILLGVRELFLLGRRGPPPADWRWDPSTLRPRDPAPEESRPHRPVRELEDA